MFSSGKENQSNVQVEVYIIFYQISEEVQHEYIIVVFLFREIGNEKRFARFLRYPL